ncbi:PALP domain-containing protein [Favolaschia claudopus]|uniref:L-serine ammonia-lyase n=1 Tax=Favolaschia claudopus TaxID=2862362 RepID=A0AAW0CTJ3_9AGAR
MAQETPLISSSPLSRDDVSVFLKLETVQPGMSFKSRGISYFVQRAKDAHGSSVHAVIASGGNAALAAACAARALNVRCAVYIPEGAAQSTVDRLKRENVEVVVGGKHYADAVIAARERVASEEKAVMVPAYEDPIIWEGHSSIILEASKQMDRKPDAIFCSVGGAGLLGGIILGCDAVGWESVPIVTLETIGSDCFYHSMALNRCGDSVKLPPGVSAIRDDANNVKLAHFSFFSSKASGSLGASEPVAGVVRKALDRKGPVTCVTVPDELSMHAGYSFADDHKILVELSCSTTLVPAYRKELLDRLVPPTGAERSVLFIVCGGFKVFLSDMVEYRSQFEACQDTLEVYCDGEAIKIPK